MVNQKSESQGGLYVIYYESLCQGYATNKERKEPHRYVRLTPQYPGSHGICPDCLSLYRKELIQSKLEEAVQTNES